MQDESHEAWSPLAQGGLDALGATGPEQVLRVRHIGVRPCLLASVDAAEDELL